MKKENCVKDDIMYRFFYDSNTDSIVAEVAYAVARTEKTVTIPCMVENIPVVRVAAGAFAQMRQLEKVYIETSKSLQICKDAFSLCPNLFQVESYSDTLYLEKKAFFDNPSLTNFLCYGKLNLMGENIFFKCPSMKKIHGRISVLKPYALSGATGLKKLCFEKNVDIHAGALNGCPPLELWFIGNANFIPPALPEMLKDCKILCRKSSNLTDLAYEGYDVETTALLNLSAF